VPMFVVSRQLGTTLVYCFFLLVTCSFFFFLFVTCFFFWMVCIILKKNRNKMMMLVGVFSLFFGLQCILLLSDYCNNNKVPSSSSSKVDRRVSFFNFTVLAAMTAGTITLFGENVRFCGWGKLMFDASVWFVVSNCIFYVTHRLCHTNRTLWKRVHHVHHQYVDTEMCVTWYAHPLEIVGVNWLSLCFPIILLRPDFWLCICVSMGAFWSVFSAHDSVGSAFHAAHHNKFNVNFGSMYLPLDTLLGTAADIKVASE
jgi:sterol desaturase/sphingolipid hydroxylase (fatty acid hydroxylase superfamily)